MQVVNIYIAYETGLWPFHVDLDFALKNSLFGTVRLTKNPDFHQCKYFCYGIEFVEIFRCRMVMDLKKR